MKLQLLSISHKTASTQIRGLFAFEEEKQLTILKKLVDNININEAVILSTCNRTELYCSGSDDNHILHRMQEVILDESGTKEIPGIRDCILRFQGESAIHHLFMVTAGLDSIVIGEDQILGQVKQAYFFSKEHGYCKSTFHSLFRLAITAAKKVKTDTLLSKTSVSTASLALKKALQCHGTLKNKKIMIIGASGKIGSTILKDALDMEGLCIFVTVRKHLPHELHKRNDQYVTIAYEERYHWIDQMDIIISATSSPHYTITKEHFIEYQKTNKKRVFFDLAVPLDIESSISTVENTLYYCMEDMDKLADQNNKLKLSYIPKAELIIKKYEEEFFKGTLYSENIELIDHLKEKICNESKIKPLDKVIEHLFYDIKEESNAEEFDHFLHIIKRLLK